MRWTEEEYAAYEARRRKGNNPSAPSGQLPLHRGAKEDGGKRTKYGNRRVEIDGRKFDSQHEAEVYGELMLRQRAGELKLVLRQVPFELPGGIKYIADFVTMDHAGSIEVIDAKSEITRKNRVFINKKKQMASEWGIEVKEV